MPNRARPLVPGGPETTSRGSLTRNAIISEAIALADAGGLDAVSIRRVAARLNARPMTIYSYVASKNDLLALMADAVVAEVILPPPLPNGWRPALAAIAQQSHKTFTRHPWLPAISEQRSNLGRNAVRHAEQLLAAISELDLLPADRWSILYAVNDLTLGHALRIAHDQPHGPRGYPTFDADAFPHLNEALKNSTPRRGDATFDAELDLLLDAIEMRHGST